MESCQPIFRIWKLTNHHFAAGQLRKLSTTTKDIQLEIGGLQLLRKLYDAGVLANELTGVMLSGAAKVKNSPEYATRSKWRLDPSYRTAPFMRWRHSATAFQPASSARNGSNSVESKST